MESRSGMGAGVGELVDYAGMDWKEKWGGVGLQWSEAGVGS